MLVGEEVTVTTTLSSEVQDFVTVELNVETGRLKLPNSKILHFKRSLTDVFTDYISFEKNPVQFLLSVTFLVEFKFLSKRY